MSNIKSNIIFQQLKRQNCGSSTPITTPTLSLTRAPTSTVNGEEVGFSKLSILVSSIIIISKMSSVWSAKHCRVNSTRTQTSTNSQLKSKSLINFQSGVGNWVEHGHCQSPQETPSTKLLTAFKSSTTATTRPLTNLTQPVSTSPSLTSAWAGSYLGGGATLTSTWCRTSLLEK